MLSHQTIPKDKKSVQFDNINTDVIFSRPPIKKPLNMDYSRLYETELQAHYPRLFFHQTDHVLKKLLLWRASYHCSMHYNSIKTAIDKFAENFYHSEHDAAFPAEYFKNIKQTLEDVYFYLTDPRIDGNSKVNAYENLYTDLISIGPIYVLKNPTLNRSVKRDYVELYNNDSAVNEYRTEEVGIRHQFEQQTYQLLQALNEWGEEYKKNQQSELIECFKLFSSKLFAERKSISPALLKKFKNLIEAVSGILHSESSVVIKQKAFTEFYLALQKDASLKEFIFPVVSFKEGYLHTFKNEENISSCIPGDIKNNKQFLMQVFFVLREIKDWKVQSNLEELSSIATKFSVIQDNLFRIEYAGEQKPEWFEKIKTSLENIYFRLTQPGLDAAVKWRAFNDLYSNSGSCSPGLFTIVESVLYQLTKDVSIASWLTELRGVTIDFLAEDYIHTSGVRSGNSIHVYNSFYTYAENEDWNPPLVLRENTDIFALNTTGIDVNTIEKFHKNFLKEYNQPKVILNCLMMHVASEVNLLISEFQLKKEGKGWLGYSKPFFDKVDHIFNLLEISEDAKEQIFTWHDDGDKFKFDLVQLKFFLVNFCFANQRVFTNNALQKTSINESEFFFIFEDNIVSINRDCNAAFAPSLVYQLGLDKLQKLLLVSGYADFLKCIDAIITAFGAEKVSPNILLNLLKAGILPVIIKNLESLTARTSELSLDEFTGIFSHDVDWAFSLMDEGSKEELLNTHFAVILKLLLIHDFYKLFSHKYFINSVDKNFAKLIHPESGVNFSKNAFCILDCNRVFQEADEPSWFAFAYQYNLWNYLPDIFKFIPKIMKQMNLSEDEIKGKFSKTQKTIKYHVRSRQDLLYALYYFSEESFRSNTLRLHPDMLPHEDETFADILPAHYFSDKQLCAIIDQLEKRVWLDHFIKRIDDLEVIAKSVSIDKLVTNRPALLNKLVVNLKSFIRALALVGPMLFDMLDKQFIDEILNNPIKKTYTLNDFPPKQFNIIVGHLEAHHLLDAFMENCDDLALLLCQCVRKEEFIKQSGASLFPLITTMKEFALIVHHTGDAIFKALNASQIKAILSHNNENFDLSFLTTSSHLKEDAKQILKIIYVHGYLDNLIVNLKCCVDIHKLMPGFDILSYLKNYPDIFNRLGLQSKGIKEALGYFGKQLIDKLLAREAKQVQTWEIIFQLYLVIPKEAKLDALIETLPATQLKMANFTSGLKWLLYNEEINTRDTLHYFKKLIEGLLNNASNLMNLFHAVRPTYHSFLVDMFKEKVATIIKKDDLHSLRQIKGIRQEIWDIVEKILLPSNQFYVSQVNCSLFSVKAFKSDLQDEVLKQLILNNNFDANVASVSMSATFSSFSANLISIQLDELRNALPANFKVLRSQLANLSAKFHVNPHPWVLKKPDSIQLLAAVFLIGKSLNRSSLFGKCVELIASVKLTQTVSEQIQMLKELADTTVESSITLGVR